MIATNQYCPKTGISSPVTIASGKTVKVQPGCQIPTMEHVITAEDSDNFEIKTTWLDWTMTLAQLFDHEDTEQLMQMVKEIRSTISGTFDASELLQRLDALYKPFQSNHWLFSSPAGMIGTVLLLFSRVICYLQKVRSKVIHYTISFFLSFGSSAAYRCLHARIGYAPGILQLHQSPGNKSRRNQIKSTRTSSTNSTTKINYYH